MGDLTGATRDGSLATEPTGDGVHAILLASIGPRGFDHTQAGRITSPPRTSRETRRPDWLGRAGGASALSYFAGMSTTLRCSMYTRW